MKRRAGFVMIEVLVSLVLVTSVGIAIVVWAESGLHSVARLHDEFERMRALRLCQDWVRSLPENTEPKGETTLAGWKIRWERKLLAQTSATGYPRGIAPFDALLYQYDYQVYRQAGDNQAWFSDQAVVNQSRLTRSSSSIF